MLDKGKPKYPNTRLGPQVRPFARAFSGFAMLRAMFSPAPKGASHD